MAAENNTSHDDELVNVEHPEDLVIDILLRLPIKSLIRFKTVCKPWNTLINSPVFIDEHLQRKNPLHGLFPITCPPEEDNHLPFKVDCFVGTCNGIICFKTTDIENPLVLYNPSTRESSLLPKECSGNFYGFCYLSQTQEYKVFSFKWLSSHDNDVDMRILTLGTRTKALRDVKDIVLPGQINHGYDEATQATLGSSIFWLGYNDGDGSYDDIVICYDAFEDKFSSMNAPPSSVDDVIRSLGVIKDSVIMFVFPYDVTSFDIWILIDDGSKDKSWMKYRNIGPFETCVIIQPIHACPDCRWILCSKSDDEFGYQKSINLFYYDLETGEVEDYEATDSEIVIMKFVNHVESRVSPKRICSMN